MDDWLLDILIRPNLDAKAAKAVAKHLSEAIKTELSSKNLGSIKVDDKDLEKSAGNLLKSVNSVLRDLSKNIKSFTKTIEQAQSKAGAAAATTVRASRAIRPVSATPDPGYPSRSGAGATAAAFSGSGGTSSGAATKSRTAAVKKELESKAKKSTDLYRDAFTLLLETPAEFSKTLNVAASKLKVKAKSESQKVTRALTENVTNIIEALRIIKVDPGIVSNLQQYRQPIKNLTSRFRQENLGSPPVTKATLDKQFSSKQYKYADEQGSGFGELKSAIKALAGVAKKPGHAPEVSVTSLLSEISKLTSGAGKPGAVKASGKEEFGKLQSQTDGLVRDTLRRLLLKLESETKKIGKRIDAVKSKGAEGAEAEVVRLSGKFNDKVNKQLEVLRAINRPGRDRFNINLQRNVSGSAGKPGVYKEEAGFLQESSKRGDMTKELGLNKAAAQAVKIAKSFKDIPDPVERADKIFKGIWAASKRGSGDLSKTIALVSETLKNTHVKGLVNRRELQEVTGLLDKYRSQIENFRVQTKGLGGAKTAHPVVPAAFNVAEEGGTNRAYLRRVEQIRRDIAGDANIKKGVKIPITIPVETAGGIRNIRVEFNKLGNTFNKVIPKAKEMTRSMSMRDSIGQAFRRVSLWGAAAGITYGAINAFRQAGRTMTEVETGVVNLSKVVRSADSDLLGFADRAVASAKRIATEYGTSMQEVFKSMRIFAQQGLEMVEVIELTEATSIAANTTVLDQAKAADGLTSAIKQFGLEASSSMQIVDAWNEVAKRNAVTELTLVDALKKAGSAARTVGVDFNQLIGLTTAVGEATRQPGKEVGTSLRFIFQRTLRPDSAKALAKVGVATKDLEGNFRGFMAIIGDLAGMWEDLSNGQQLAIAQALGGARQYNAVVALMNNYATAVKASEDALNSQGSAQLENVKVMGTTTKIFAQTKASLDAVSVSMGKIFLPVVKTAASGMKSLLDVFASMPAELHTIVGGMALATVGLARFSHQADMVMMGGMGAAEAGGGGIAAGLAGGLAGRGRQADALTEGPGLGGEVGLAAVGLSDFAKGSGRELHKLEGALVGVNGKAVKGAEGFSKMGLAVRHMSHESIKSGESVKVGFKHMNSPISKMLLLFGLLGKEVLLMGTRIGNALMGAIENLSGFSKASRTAAASSRIAATANIGLAGSFSGLLVGGAVITGVYLLGKHIYDVATAQRKTGAEVQKSLRSELSKRQEVLRALQSQRSLLGSLATAETNVAKAEKRQAGGEKAGFKQPTAELRRYRHELKKVDAGGSVATISPEHIERFDQFGNVILRASEAFKEMGQAAVEAQAHMVALTRLKMAKAFADDVVDAEKTLNKLMRQMKDVHEVATEEVFAFGSTNVSTDKYKNTASKINKQSAKGAVLVGNMVAQIKALPKDISLFSLEEFVQSEAIMSALSVSIRKNNSALQAMGKPAATAVDKIQQLYLTVKGFKGIGLTVFETKAILQQAGVASATLEEVVKAFEVTKKRLSGGELVLIEGSNPFGLTQASTEINAAGEIMVKGLNRSGKEVEVEFEKFSRRMKAAGSNVVIIDPTTMNKQLGQSILKIQRKISGAGAGLIDIPGNLDLGVNFDFQLGDVDRLQKVGREAAQSIVEVYQAQRQYNAALTDFKKGYKDDPSSQLSAERAKSLNMSRATLSAMNHMVKFMSVLEKVSNSFAKATHELNKAAIADRVEAEFGSVYGTIAGYSEKLTVKLPKTLDELSPDERLSRSNPELVSGIRAGQRAMDKLKSQIVAMEQLSGGDIQKMFEAFTNQDQKIFTSAMESLGGDLKGSVIVTHLGSLERINKKGFGDLLKALSPGVGAPTAAVSGKSSAKKAASDGLAAIGNYFNRLQTTGPSGATKFSFGGSALTGGSVSQGNKELFGALQRELGISTGKSVSRSPVGSVRQSYRDESKTGAQKEGRLGQSELLKIIQKIRSEGRDRPSREELGAIKGLTVKNLYDNAERLKKRADEVDVRRGIKGGIEGGVGPKALLGRGLRATAERQIRTAQELGGYKEGLSPKGQLGVSGLQAAIQAANPLGRYEKLIDKVMTNAIKAAGSAQAGIGVAGRKARPESAAVVANAARASSVDAVLKALDVGLKLARKAAKRVQKELLGMAQALGFVGKRVESFIYNISKGIDQIRNTRDLGRLTRDISAPIAGQLKGVSVSQVGLGKLKGDLSPVERVAKQFSSYFTNIAEQETARTGAVGLFSNMSGQLLKVRKDIKGLLTGGEKLSNREGLLKLQTKAESLYKSMGSEMSRVNNKMSPFIESLTKMVRLEAAKKSIDDIINSLKKAEDLEFDTTSIDMAFGKHPLSAVRPQFGEPAGLDKFQQQLFQLQQKQRAGTISGQDFSYEKKKIGFQKEESLIQYQQTKENSKLRAEIESARRAMGILWDAQSQGIGGVGSLIETLKTDLESAGEATDVGGVREFKGVPGLFGINKELAKVQAAVKEKDFSQQRDIVMAPLEGLQTESNKLLTQVKTAIDAQTKSISSSLGGDKDKDLAGKVGSFYKGATGEIAEEFKKAMSVIGETVTRTAEIMRTGTDEHVPKLLGNIDAASSGIGRLGKSAVANAKAITGVTTYIEKSISIPSAAPNSPTATPARNKATGGFITGPAGIDNVPARLTAGEYVIPKNVVSQYGTSFFDSIRSGKAQGFYGGGGVGKSIDVNKDMADIFGITGILKSGGDYSVLSSKGNCSSKNVSGSYGYTKGTGGFVSSGGTSFSGGREKKSGYTGLTTADLDSAKFVVGGKSFNSQREIDEYYKFNTTEAFDAFGPSPGQMNARTLYNSGGKVSGAGGIDNVPARLTKGEYVIPKGVVDKYGTGFFDSLRSGKISGFADGGSVGQQANGTNNIKPFVSMEAFENSLKPVIMSMDAFENSLKPAFISMEAFENSLKPAFISMEAFENSLKPAFISMEAFENSLKPAFISMEAFENSLKPTTLSMEAFENSLKVPVPQRGGSSGGGSSIMSQIADGLKLLKSEVSRGGNLDLDKFKVVISDLKQVPAPQGNKVDLDKFKVVISDLKGKAAPQSNKEFLDKFKVVISDLKGKSEPQNNKEFLDKFKVVISDLKGKVGSPSGGDFWDKFKAAAPGLNGGRVPSSVVGRGGFKSESGDIIEQPGFSVMRPAVPGVRSAATTTQLPPESLVNLTDKIATAINSAYDDLEIREINEMNKTEKGIPGTYFGLGSRPSTDRGSVTSGKFQDVQSSVWAALEKFKSAGPGSGAGEDLSLVGSLKQSRSAAAELFRSNKDFGGLPLPKAFQSEEQRRAGVQALSAEKQATLPEGYKSLITSLATLTDTLGGLKEGLPPPEGFKPEPKKPAEIKEGAIPEGSLDKVAGRVYNALIEAIRDSEISISKDSLAEMEASIRRGGESIADNIAKAAPTLSGATGGGSLGAAVRPELEQLNGRVDAISEKIILEKDALLSNLNERFSDAETQMMSEIKGLYDAKFVQADTKSDSTLAYVRRVEALLHSVNSRTGDL